MRGRAAGLKEYLMSAAMACMPFTLIASLPSGLFHPICVAQGGSGGVAILLLCILAGIGTVMCLPGQREVAFTRIGAAIVLAAMLLGGAVIARRSSGWSFADIYFWIFSFIALATSLRVITHRKPVYSALYFVLTVLASAGLFILLWAEFMAAALILIYAGAILITYVFVIMLASQSHTGLTGAAADDVGGAEYDLSSREPIAAAAIGFTLMGLILFVIFEKAPATIAALPGPDQTWTTAALAHYLFTDQTINLELAGVILTLAMVGAIVIAQKRVASEQVIVADTIDADRTPTSDDPHSIPVYGTRNARLKEYPDETARAVSRESAGGA